MCSSASVISPRIAGASIVAGDGTTTATVLAQSIYAEGSKNVTAGANPMDRGYLSPYFVTKPERMEAILAYILIDEKKISRPPASATGARRCSRTSRSPSGSRQQESWIHATGS